MWEAGIPNLMHYPQRYVPAPWQPPNSSGPDLVVEFGRGTLSLTEAARCSASRYFSAVFRPGASVHDPCPEVFSTLVENSRL